MSIAILGAGAFGTALAIALARDGREVVLWGRETGAMQMHRENSRRLPGFAFPEALEVTDDIARAEGADIVLLGVPMQALAGFLELHGELFRDKPVIATCKGIDLETGLNPAEIIARACPSARPALLSGPSFAVDIAAGLPTALTLAAEDGADLQEALATPTLRLYRAEDMSGVALGGALKNVVAIAAGLTIGAGMGDSARAALMARGFAEMVRFATARGARAETLSGLSGLGDLVLTCTSEKSRNFRHGLALGRGEVPEPGVTVEGVATARAVEKLAREVGIDMPVAEMVVAVTEGRLSPEDARAHLLARPLREE